MPAAISTEARNRGPPVSGHSSDTDVESSSAEQHLLEGAALARSIGRPYLEVSCLGRLGFGSKRHSFAVARERCKEAIELAERHGLGQRQSDRVSLGDARWNPGMDR